MSPHWVVKLGGSLSKDRGLDLWLRLLADKGCGRVVIVPGGGLFADQVRAAQQSVGFDDVAAHYMALLAMAQTAIMLNSFEPKLAIADNAEEIGQQLSAGRTVIWRPLDMLVDRPEVRPGWDITADSLALWLANQLGARSLLLVKSCNIDRTLDTEQLSRIGVLDERFPTLLRTTRVRVKLLSRWELDRAQSLIEIEGTTGALSAPGFSPSAC